MKNGVNAYRIEWRLKAASCEAGQVTRWSAHTGSGEARRAAAIICGSPTTIDGEVRVSLVGDAASPCVVAAAKQVGDWRDDAPLPDDLDASGWKRANEAAGVRSAALLACRAAFLRAINAGLMVRAHSATLLTAIALALDGEDPAVAAKPDD